jgi:hypothetical protein
VDARLIALVVGLALGAWVMARASAWLRRRRVNAHFARARQREALAGQLLEDAGYIILASQVTAPCPIDQDGVRRVADVRADYLVERRGRTWIAEAKSGPRATDPTERNTRRQLLEYAITYDVAGVLLVDAETGRISKITFPHLPRDHFWRGVAVGAIAVGLGAWAVASIR